MTKKQKKSKLASFTEGVHLNTAIVPAPTRGELDHLSPLPLPSWECSPFHSWKWLPFHSWECCRSTRGNAAVSLVEMLPFHSWECTLSLSLSLPLSRDLPRVSCNVFELDSTVRSTEEIYRPPSQDEVSKIIQRLVGSKKKMSGCHQYGAPKEKKRRKSRVSRENQNEVNTERELTHRCPLQPREGKASATQQQHWKSNSSRSNSSSKWYTGTRRSTVEPKPVSATDAIYVCATQKNKALPVVFNPTRGTRYTATKRLNVRPYLRLPLCLYTSAR